MSNIVTDLENLDAQFKKYDKIIIPLYQRSYAWDGNDVQVFWRDIKDSINEDRARYFIGPIVSKSIDQKKVEIIDGQQRLTTSLALLSIIKRICLYKYKEDEKNNLNYYNFWNTLNNRFFVTDSLLSENGSKRYQMNEENDQIFEDFIAADASRSEILDERKKYKKGDSNYKLLDSIICLWDFVDEFLGANTDLMDLKLIAVYILEKLQILNISVSDESDAFLIFETINDRGRALDTMDLVKSLLFSKAKGTAFEKVKNNWVRMQEHLSNMSTANDFLYNFWTSYEGKTSKQSLFSQIREHIKSAGTITVDFSNAITEAARIYSAIANPSDEMWSDHSKEARNNLQTLKELSAKAIHPILMAAKIYLEKDEFNKLLRYLIVFQVRYVLIADYHTGRYSDAIATIPSRIRSKELNKAIKIAKALKEQDIYTNDQVFIDSFKTLTCTTKRAKYILSEIENLDAGNLKTTNADGDIVNIEHILPQESCPEWNKEITGISIQEYETWANRLGNMVLSCTKLNKEAARKPFIDKKKILIEKSHDFKTTHSIMACSEWNKDSIEKRQAELAYKALKVWSIDF